MDEDSKSIDSTKSSGIAIYPAEVPDEDDSPEDQIRRGIRILLTRKRIEDILHIHSGEGLKIMHFRYDNVTHRIQMMFKRAPEIRPYYTAIKTWCETHNFSWKDKTHSGEKYLTIALRPNLDVIIKAIHSANEDIFKVKQLHVGASSPHLSLALNDMSHPFLFVFFGLGLLVSVVLLPLYEIFRLPYIEQPSFGALDWPELFLILLLIAGIISIRSLGRSQSNSNSRLKVYLIRGVILLTIGLAFFTY